MTSCSTCIEWHRARNAAGYGIRKYGGRSALAHRVAYCDAHGLRLADIDGLVVRHSCDNRACINPDHLLIGTQLDNIRDMEARGRRRVLKGAEHGRAKLTPSDVQTIREVYAPRVRGLVASLAARFHVSQKQIVAVVARRAWKV